MREVTEVRLRSILELRTEIEDHVDEVHQRIIEEHTFVGLIDDELGLLQYQTQLYLVNVKMLRSLSRDRHLTDCSEALFFQLALKEFANFGSMRISPAVSVAHMVAFTDSDKTKSATDLLVSKRSMLDEYFNIVVSESGMITCFPLLLLDYLPHLCRLPSLIRDLTEKVRHSCTLDLRICR